MDADADRRWRAYGMMSSALAGVVLALWAIYCALEALLGR